MGANSTVNPDCHQYFSELSIEESAEQKRLIDYIKETGAPFMQVDRLQGQFLNFFSKAIRAKHILEIGSFVGYSTLWLARALPKDGKLISCDINQSWSARAKQAYIVEKIDHKIEQMIQPALETLDNWINKKSYVDFFDLIFIDADKSNYPEYIEKCLKILSVNGVIILDNVWWSGTVTDDTNQQKRTKILRNLNLALSKNSELDISFVPMGDGMILIKPKISMTTNHQAVVANSAEIQRID